MNNRRSHRSAVALLVAAFALAAVPLGAQSAQPKPKWWLSDQYKRELALTADQSQRLETIFQAALPTLRANLKTLDDEEHAFALLMDRADEAEVIDQLGRLEAARAALSKSRVLMSLKMRKVLSATQWHRLRALLEPAERDAPKK